MIRYLQQEEKKNTEELYREAFPEDKDEFVKYYYSYVTRDNQILAVEQAGEICSMLHLNPYRLSVNGTAVDACYYVAVATKENYRHQGMMRSLLCRSLNDIYEKKQPFAYLMPASKEIYEPFEFRIVYEQKKVELPLNPEAANQKMAEMYDVYTLRNPWYVEKMLEEERICAGDTPFEIVPYIMTRITHVPEMLKLLRSRQPLEVLLDIKDEMIAGNHGIFLWKVSEECSECVKTEEKILEELPVISLSIGQLTKFVFGKRMVEGLEQIQTLSRICINEAV